MLRERRWWRKYCPTWKIVNIGQAKITCNKESVFHIELPIEVEYVSRDNRHSTRMDCATIRLDMYNKGKDRDKAPYILRSDVELGVWDLPPGPGGIKRKQYNFVGNEEGVPLIGKSTVCKIVAIGCATIYRISSTRELPKSSQFKVNVSWETDAEV